MLEVDTDLRDAGLLLVLFCAAPLAAAVAVLVAHSIRQRSPLMALGAAAVLNLSVCLGYALHATAAGRAFTAEDWQRLVDLNAIASGLFTAAWLMLLNIRHSSAS